MRDVVIGCAQSPCARSLNALEGMNQGDSSKVAAEREAPACQTALLVVQGQRGDARMVAVTQKKGGIQVPAHAPGTTRIAYHALGRQEHRGAGKAQCAIQIGFERCQNNFAGSQIGLQRMVRDGINISMSSV